MRKPNFGGKRSAETIVVFIATLAALALLGAVLAYWTWIGLAPRPEPRARTAEEAPRIESAYMLFGNAQRVAIAPTGIALTLLAVAAASGGRPGHTIVQIEGSKSVVVREGDEVVPGIRLAEVHRDHIILERNGLRETLEWPKQNRTPVASQPPRNP